MSRRDHVDARCDACHMRRPQCICALVPRIRTTRSRLLLLVHYREARKPTNTGQLAARCLEHSRVAIVGDLARPLPDPLFAHDERAVLLFPAPDAIPLAQLASAPDARPITLVVPDGTWRQADKMGRRIPALVRLPRVTLDDPRASEYRLRAEPREGGLATLEAIGRALRVLESDAVEAELLSVFREMVRRTLHTRGVNG